MEVSEIAKSRIECLFNRVEQLTYDLAPQLENFPKKERTLLTLNIRTTLFELLAKLVSSEYVVSRRVAYLQQCHSKVILLNILMRFSERGKYISKNNYALLEERINKISIEIDSLIKISSSRSSSKTRLT